MKFSRVSTFRISWSSFGFFFIICLLNTLPISIGITQTIPLKILCIYHIFGNSLTLVAYWAQYDPDRLAESRLRYRVAASLTSLGG